MKEGTDTGYQEKTQSRKLFRWFLKITRIYGIGPIADYPHTSIGHKLSIMIKVQMDMV